MPFVRLAATALNAVLGFVLMLLAAAPAFAENWPMWRGPRGDGSSNESNLATRWSATENVRWKVLIPGKGHSSPVVWGDCILVTTCLEDTQQRILLCLNRN